MTIATLRMLGLGRLLPDLLATALIGLLDGARPFGKGNVRIGLTDM